jgi:Leucine-rich repeat (LRR) protein
MSDFIKKLEKSFDTQIIHSEKHIPVNYYSSDHEGNITTLYLDEIKLNELDVLLPLADTLIKLALVECNIRTLRGLKLFANLELLDLRLNRLHGSTFSHLTHLKKLKKLDLSATNLKDTSFVSSLTNLEMLFVGGTNRLCEIKGIENLTSLYHLGASYSEIDSIKKIGANQNLRSLNLEGNPVEKLTHLNRFPNLEILNLNSSLVDKIEGLNELQNLKELFITGAYIKRIEGLENLKKLEILDLCENQIFKIEGLDYLLNLKELSLNKNPIITVENLDNLINLKLLLLDACKNVVHFDTRFFQNLISDCHIYIRGLKDVDSIKALAPKNVKINFDENYHYPTSLYHHNKNNLKYKY